LKTKGELNPKYPGGLAELTRKLSGEGHRVIQKGKRVFVENFEASLAPLGAVGAGIKPKLEFSIFSKSLAESADPTLVAGAASKG
jgi:hypothetical protein